MRSRGPDLIPVVQRSYALCAGLFEHVNRFPRAQLAKHADAFQLSGAIFTARGVRNVGKRLLVRAATRV